jgi:hypothetical protein
LGLRTQSAVVRISITRTEPILVLSPQSSVLSPQSKTTVPLGCGDASRPRPRPCVFWFLSVLWSGNWLLIKVGLKGLPPFRFAGPLWGSLLGHEQITGRTVAGGALILSGFVTVTVRTRAPSAAASAAVG